MQCVQRVSDINKTLGNSHPPSHRYTHLPPVAITNKLQMTQEEVCVRTGWRNPTGPSWKTATGTAVMGCCMCAYSVYRWYPHSWHQTSYCRFKHIMRCVTLLQALTADWLGWKDFSLMVSISSSEF